MSRSPVAAAEEDEEAAEVRAWSWGAGTEGQLATGVLHDQLRPQPVRALAPVPISRVACGGAHALAVTQDGRVLTWGRGKCGQLGHGDLENCLQPKLVNFLESFTISFISAGWNHSGFITDTRRLFMCGDGQFGQLGTGDYQSRGSPVEVLYFATKYVEQIACGMRHSLVLVKGPSGDSIYGFGAGRHGQIGLFSSGMIRTNNLPVVIEGFNSCNVICLCASGDHSAALTSTGQLYTWGRGFCGKADEHSPQVLPSLLRFSQVALGWNHALLLADNLLYILGGNRHGMLSTHKAPICSASSKNLDGDASVDPILEKVHGLDGERIVHLAAGAEHSALVTERGSVMTWGWGEHGQLGLGNRCDQTCPCIVNMDFERPISGSHLRVYCGSGFTFVVKSGYCSLTK